MPKWTIQRVKEQLPPVKVKIGKKSYDYGKVIGRQNDFATVSITKDGLYIDYQFAWPTVVRALNSDRPLLID